MTTRIITDDELDKAGEAMAEVFGCKRSREHRDRWQLGGGHLTKTSKGLALTACRLVDELRGVSANPTTPQNPGSHTPGPWTINEWTQSDSSIAIGAVGTPLIARAIFRDVSINEQKANARLIAASPELLAALEVAQCYVNSEGSDVDRLMVSAALDKAKGAQ